ncbi:MAG TPA: DUF6569 family protein [Myxococcota bacterium]|jgi:hypothetical protein
MHPPASASTAPDLSPIAELLGRLALAPRQTHKALTLWPLVLREDVPLAEGPGYVPLARALEDGSVQIDELDERGSVPLVRVRNRGSLDVLFLFGEEIRGAKQNRIANASFLVPARGELVIDVSCVEQGRWGRRGRIDFAPSGEIFSQRMRKKMAQRVAESRRRGGRFEANQMEVWQEIGERLAQTHTASATDSYEDYVRSRRADLSDLLAAFRPLGRQVGFLAVAGDRIVGLEAIGRPEVFAEQFEGLVRSYAVDAIDPPLGERARERRAAGADSPEAFLAALGRAPAERARSLGLGDDLRIEGEGVAGCALVAGEVIHLTAFPSPAASLAPGEG